MPGLEEWLKRIREEFCKLLPLPMGLTFKNAIEEAEIFINESEEDLKKWWDLLYRGEIDIEELQWLVKARLDTGTLSLLKHAGLSLVALDRLKIGIVEMFRLTLLK